MRDVASQILGKGHVGSRGRIGRINRMKTRCIL